MHFVFCILFFKQFDAFEKVFSKCFNKYDVHSSIISNIRPLQGWGGGQNCRIEVRWYRACVIPCDLLVPHIDSRVKIIDNERPGASPCDLLLVIVVSTIYAY